MRNFDKISIQEMSKEDMLMIIEALEYTGSKSGVREFIDLKDSILEELSSLSDTDSEDFLAYLKKSCES